MKEVTYPKEHPELLTVTCLEWRHVLLDDGFKEIIIESLLIPPQSHSIGGKREGVGL